MSMIDSSYKTVLALLNKNSFGFLSVQDFNQYAKQAQLDIYEDLFAQYNKQLNLENLRQSGSGLANLAGIIEETIDMFSVTNFLVNSSDNIFTLPSLITTGDDWYHISKMICYNTQLDSGSSTSTVASQLVSSSASFITDNVAIGDIVVNTTDNTSAYVVTVSSSTALILDANIFTSGETYKIFQKSTPTIAEKVSQSKITELNISLLTTPNTTFPVYTQQGNSAVFLPTSISTYGMVQSQYYRFPYTPKWTYVVVNGSAIFDQSQPDYQDFELSAEFEPLLITKILQMAGLEIREADIFQAAQMEEQKIKQR